MKEQIKKNILLVATLILSFYLIESSLGNLTIGRFIVNLFKYKSMNSLSLLFLAALMMLFLTLINNVISTVLIVLLSSFSFRIANSQKIYMRGEPIFPHDLREIINVSDLYIMMAKKEQVFALVLIIIVILLLIAFNKSKLLENYKTYFKSNSKRFLTFTLSLTVIILFSGINSFNKPLSIFFSNSGFRYSRWDPLKTYRENGVVISFIRNFPGVSMDKPAEYNINKMSELSNNYSQIAKELNKDRMRDNFEDINLVYVLSESLADPSRISTIDLSDNPLAYIQREEDKNTSGMLLTQEYGGGTANVEFEILTSLSTNFLLPNMSLPYQDILAYKSTFPSIARQTKIEGRKSIAMHSFHSKFYQRRKVFENLGFDEMFFEGEFTNLNTLDGSNYISDKSSYKEIIDFISNENSLFIHFITMQNHTPYQDMHASYPIKVTSEIEEGLDLIKIYTEEIRQTDIATEEFIEEIKQLDNDTIVVLYGDHLPPIYSNHLTEDDYLSKHLTDFFIYSNFSDKRLEIDEVTPTYYINNLVYELADVKITPFMAFIEKFNEEFSGMLKNKFITKDGSMLTYEELSDHQKELVNHYILIQYDIIEGNCYFANVCN